MTASDEHVTVGHVVHERLGEAAPVPALGGGVATLRGGGVLAVAALVGGRGGLGRGRLPGVRPVGGRLREREREREGQDGVPRPFPCSGGARR
jgi:hypothetical protein